MSGIISADFLFSVEKDFRVINELNYMKMLASPNYWASKVLRVSSIEGKSERLMWLLSTASIEQLTANDGGESGGSLNFDQLATLTTEFFPAHHGRGFKIGKLEYLNTRAHGIDPIAKWAGDIGAYGAYVPQRLAAQFLLNGDNITGYDGVPYWSKIHPTHPLISSLGTYANTFTGAPVAASGLTPAYPGTLPIDDSVSVDTALTHLSQGLAYITGAISQPNGAGDPRMLEPAFVLYPPRMQARITQLFDADFIAQLAGSGTAAGTGDVKAILKKYRMADPVKALELDGSRSYTFKDPITGLPRTVTGDDKTYYIVCKEAAESQLGALVHTVRLPFSLQTYSGESGTEGIDAVLGRSNDLEYHYQGWQSVNPGHPFTIFRFQGT